METKIKLKEKQNIIRIGIEDENGKDTGNYLEFDLEDVSLPLRYNQAMEEHKKNINYLKMSFALIDKKPNHEGKKLLSSNEEDKFKVLEKFFEKEIQNLDMILGEGGTLKILNGRKPYYQMFNDIMEYLEPITPLFEKGFKDLRDNIASKYKTENVEDDNVMEG